METNMDINPTPKKFKCLKQIDFKPVVLAYRDVALYRSNSTSEQWKLKQYTPTNHIKSHTFNSLDDCAAYIDSVLDSNPDDIIWTVRASTLKWFAR